jgi:hypothetical protein
MHVSKDNSIGSFIFRFIGMEGCVFGGKSLDYCSIGVGGFGLNFHLIVG